MESVNIAQLKNNFSSYLKRVRSGEEIVVSDRNQPVALLVPWKQESGDDLAALAALGKLRLGTGEIEESFWKMPAPRIDKRIIRQAIEAERADD